MHVYVCICCGQPIAKKGKPLRRNPNICVACSSLADGLEMTKEGEASSKESELSKEPYRFGKAA